MNNNYVSLHKILNNVYIGFFLTKFKQNVVVMVLHLLGITVSKCVYIFFKQSYSRINHILLDKQYL